MTASMESHCIPFREIPHTTKLFSAFLEDFGRVSSFFAHPPTAAGIDAAAHDVKLDPGVRRSVVEILRGQNRKFGPGGEIEPATARNLDRLAAGAVAIVTGQQVGLFSGPALSFYKALSAVRCAEETTRRGTDAVPIFWLATQDHDLAEVNHSPWNTRNGSARYELPANEADAGRHVGEVLFGESIEPIVAAAAQSLEGTFAEVVARALRESYACGETYGSAFAKLLARLLAGRGVIFLDPLDARFHRLAAPVYLRALEESDLLRDELLARSKELDAAGYHAQVKVTHETTLLFYKVAGRREPLRSRSGRFFAGDGEFSHGQLAAAIHSESESFSPSALLRPVVQDTLLPTAAYVGGPAEIAYMAQSQIVYRRMLGRMPAIVPRASFTIVEPPLARFLAQYGLEIREVFAGPQHLRARMEQKSLPAALSSRFDASEGALREMLKAYEEPLGRLDSTLLEALHASEGKILHQFEQLKGKVARAENFRSGVLDRHQRILLDALYPNGGLQERTLCFLPMLASNGPGLLDNLARLASVADSSGAQSCASQHHVLYL
ncbi:MAG TPA: bacillithiol biosynthesis cysteine-adding enzyme BshC [Candidatus Acidoferrales bacterium]|nr:bacillithiol biosynthesis cysteine-adding enzyme BshC [Candidatus Acidoferrales bacterium]